MKPPKVGDFFIRCLLYHITDEARFGAYRFMLNQVVQLFHERCRHWHIDADLASWIYINPWRIFLTLCHAFSSSARWCYLVWGRTTKRQWRALTFLVRLNKLWFDQRTKGVIRHAVETW